MTLISAVLWVGAGAVLGSAYLYLIGRSVAAVSDGAAWRIAVPLALRIVLAAVAFVFAARHGALPLLLMLCGFLVARTVALRRFRED